MVHAHLSAEQFQTGEILKGNVTMAPNYIDLVTDMWYALKWYYAPDKWHGYVFPHSFIDEFTRHYYFPLHEVYYIVYAAVFITLVRVAFERVICRPLVNWLELTSLDKTKFPESAWKCIIGIWAWSYCVYLLYYRYNYYHEPYLIWDDWSPGMNVPFDIKLMYFGRCAYALHSNYAIFYIEHKRKDFYAIFIHHVLTTTLIFVSYATRYHKIGLLVLFVHDIADIWLELTKLLHYLGSRQSGRKCPGFENAASVSFVIFTLCWLVFRLYLYPLKILYSAGVFFAYRGYDKGCTLYGFFNALLWILLGLNIYWFLFLLQFLYKICTGALSGLHDVREYDEVGGEESFSDDEIARWNAELREKSPLEIARWALSKAGDGKAIVSTSFGPYSAVLLRLATSIDPKIVALWIDHGYNRPATYRHAETLRTLLQLQLHVYAPRTTAAYRDVLFGSLPISRDDEFALRRFSALMKLEPFERAMKDLSPKVWLTGLRQVQNANRLSLDIVSFDPTFQVLKVNPLFYWTDAQMDSFLQEHNLPNELDYFDPAKGDEKRECGLHTAWGRKHRQSGSCFIDQENNQSEINPETNEVTALKNKSD